MKVRQPENTHGDANPDFGNEEAHQRYLENLKKQRADLKDEELKPEILKRKKPPEKQPSMF